MSSGSLRTRSHSNSFRSGLIGSYAIILLVVVLLTMLGFVHFKWWPWLISKTATAQYSSSIQSEMRLFSTIMDNLQLVYYHHAKRLLSYEQDCVPLDAIDLSQLVALPGVKDAFWVDFKQEKARCEGGSIPNDTLLKILDKSRNSNAPGGGAVQIMRRTVGGLTRFWHYKIADQRYAMLLRYQNTYYPERATQVVGLILDDDWFIRQAPAVLDSMARENPVILFMAPQPPDTSWRKVSDPYRAPNNEWKQTIGVLNGQDTLWWYGDPTVNIHEGPVKKGEDPGYYVRVELFDLRVLVNTEYPEISKEIVEGRIAVKKLFTILEIVGILLIIVFTIFIVLTRRQASRNQIALAHLAHAVKTPVARIRLSTDSLLRDMTTSPQEETEIVEEISQECDRLESAVRGAAYSLEGIGKRLSLEKVELSVELSENVERWKVQYSKSGVDLQFEKAAEPVAVQLDRNLFSVMVDNLLDNALRHTLLNKKRKNLENVRVIVSIHTEGKYSVMTIDDCGGGIPKSERKRLFKRFQRVADDAATGVSGLGLGLALVKEIAQAHNGDVSVEDNDSGGSRFKVRLPLSG